MSAFNDVLPAVDQYWRSARNIHEKVDCWALPTVRHALTKLENHKFIVSKNSGYGKMSRKVYRPAQATAAQSLMTDDTGNSLSPRLDSNQVNP